MVRVLDGDDRIVEFLRLLKENPDYASGQSLAKKAGISRSAVWKHIRKLRRLGYNIDSLHGRGYRLVSGTEFPVPWELGTIVRTSFIGRTIIHREIAESTQRMAIALAERNGAHGTTVIAEQQTSGRGRLKRKWLSPSGGIWISVILRPMMPTAASTMLPFVGAVAVCDTIIGVTGLQASVKWPNDIMINGKKVAGILLDLSAEAQTVNYAIMGIGINANIIPKNLRLERDGRPPVTSLSDELGSNINRLHLTSILLEKLEEYFVLLERLGPSTIIDMWRKRSDILGRKVSAIQQGKVISGIARDIAEDGSLVIATSGGDIDIVSGEVTVLY